MITPGFFGFFNTHRALVTNQMALNTINHNISNANTEGYSRQRVEIEAFAAYATPMLSGLTGGQMGQGSTAKEVVRIHENFIDAQFRDESAVLGQNLIMRDVLQQLEGILAEPSNSGINGAVQNFFDSIQELSLHPESIPVRADFVQQAADLLTVFQQQENQLLELRGNLVGEPLTPGSFDNSQLAIGVTEVNSLLGSVASLNQQIITINASGARPNDLLDQRDVMLNKLSDLINIDVEYLDNDLINVNIGGTIGGGPSVRAITGSDLVETLEVVQNPGGALSPFDAPSNIRTVNGGDVLNDFGGLEITGGRLKGIIDATQNNPADPNAMNLYEVLEDINNLMRNIAEQVNTVQVAGRDLNGNLTAGTPIFIVPPPAADPFDLSNFSINAITPDQVAAAINDPGAAGPPIGFAGEGDGRNALAMAQLRDANIAGLGNTTFIENFNGTISNLGIRTRTFEDRSLGQQQLINALVQRRESVSGVNIDEETIDLIRFQRAFEASSRVMRAFDEIMQTIITMT